MTRRVERAAGDAGGRQGLPPSRRPSSGARLVVTRLLLLVAVPTAALSLLGQLGARWWIFDLAAALRPQYAVVLVLTSGLLLVGGSRRAAPVFAFVALVEVALIAPLWLASPPPAAADSSLLRVHFHNVDAGGDQRFAEVVRELSSGDVDVVLLAEASVRWIDRFDATDLPHELVYPRRSQDHRRLIALSRIPIDGVQAVSLTAGDRSGGIVVDLRMDGRPLRILGVHVHSPRDADSAALRDAELEAVGDWVTAQTVPVVVVGDLNATGWSHPLRHLRRRTGLQDSQRGYGPQPTWREGTGPLMVPIDHVLHDRALTVVDRSTGPALGSAHRSVQATLAWRADG